jgi:hypothetical protein
MDSQRVKEIVSEALIAAQDAASWCFETTFNNEDKDACGVAWVDIFDPDGFSIDGRSKVGRALRAAGVKQDCHRVFTIYDPAKHKAQSITVSEAGARAAAAVFEQQGFSAFVGSRLD